MLALRHPRGRMGLPLALPLQRQRRQQPNRNLHPALLTFVRLVECKGGKGGLGRLARKVDSEDLAHARVQPRHGGGGIRQRWRRRRRRRGGITVEQTVVYCAGGIVAGPQNGADQI